MTAALAREARTRHRSRWARAGRAALAATVAVAVSVTGLSAPAHALEDPEMNAVSLPYDQHVTGTEFTVFATVTGDPVPTGDVTLHEDGDDTVLATATLDEQGLAFLTVDPATLGLGIHEMVIDYEGDEVYAAEQLFGFQTEVEATQPQQYIRRLYDDVLLRDPDPAGFTYWIGQMNGGASRNAVAHAFTHSASNYALEVLFAYLFLLEREPDPAGANHYVNAFMTRGMTNEQLDFYLASSGEFFTQAGSTNAGFVDLLYERQLARAPDPAGRAYWIGRLNAGVSRTDVAYAFVFNNENLGNEIVGLYFRFLDRLTNMDERNFGALLLGSGSVTYFQLQQAIATSPEYVDRFASVVASSSVAAASAATPPEGRPWAGSTPTSANWTSAPRPGS